MKKLTFLFLVFLSAWGCKSKYPDIPESYHSPLDSALVKAGENSVELQKALKDAPFEQKEGMAFLISYMPESDLTSLKAEFLLENVEYAYKARDQYKWCAALPDSIFFNEVLPYANISENRDAWRKDFYERFSKYADQEDKMIDAIMSIARNIKNETGVEYNTKRSRVDISPFQAMKEKMATCTGLSILLTDAYRSVGIPSHLAGTAMWTNFKGNHTWSEVWIDGEWKFIEYYPDTLNQSWFVADAGKADPDNMLHWIYAASYKPTGMPYYAAPDGSIMEVVDLNKLPQKERSRFQKMKKNVQKKEVLAWGHNVTPRYLKIYKQSVKNSKLADNELLVNIVVFSTDDTTKSESRLSCRVDVYDPNKKQEESNERLHLDFGFSPRKTDDMNQFLQFKLKKDTEYKLVVTNPANQLNKEFTVKTKNSDTQDIQLILSN